MKYAICVLALLTPLGFLEIGHAQQNTSQTCVNQYADAPSVTAAGLLTGGYEIKGAVPGGLWLQKGKEVYYCNAGRPADTQTVLCWTIAAPVKGAPC